jgi:hypothetical protein
MSYCSDYELKDAYAARAIPMEFEAFYDNVNQGGRGCSCCKQDARLYAVYAASLPIKPDMLSLCLECLRRLPDDLEVNCKKFVI